jgi:hypothetical protein
MKKSRLWEDNSRSAGQDISENSLTNEHKFYFRK